MPLRRKYSKILQEVAQSEPPEPPLLIEPPFEPPSEPPAVAPFFRHILSGRKYPKNLANRTQYIQEIYVRLTVKLRGDAEKYVTNKSTPYNK